MALKPEFRDAAISIANAKHRALGLDTYRNNLYKRRP
jgi:hypothetical protein